MINLKVSHRLVLSFTLHVKCQVVLSSHALGRDEQASKVEVFCIENGDMATLDVCKLFQLPKKAKSHPALVVAI